MYTTNSAELVPNNGIEKEVKSQFPKMLYGGEKLILDERRYPLNKSKTKFVIDGLGYVLESMKQNGKKYYESKSDLQLFLFN